MHKKPADLIHKVHVAPGNLLNNNTKTSLRYTGKPLSTKRVRHRHISVLSEGPRGGMGSIELLTYVAVLCFLASVNPASLNAKELDSKSAAPKTEIVQTKVPVLSDTTYVKTTLKKQYTYELKHGEMIVNGTRGVSLGKYLKDIFGYVDVSEEEIKLKIPARLQGGGDGVYLVFERGVVGAFADENTNEFIILSANTGKDALFIHPGALLVTSNGSLAIVTPKTIAILRHNSSRAIDCKETFGKETQDFIKPTFEASADGEHVILRDETFSGFRLILSSKPGDNSYKVEADDVEFQVKL